MKVAYISAILVPLASGFVADTPGQKTRLTPLRDATREASVDTVNRKDFVNAAASSFVAIGLLGVGEPAFATGRATLDQTFERYAPRIRAGGEFYQGEFKQMVAKGDFRAIKEATEGVPPKRKEDLQKIDAGVAARARSAGQFSEDRVLTAGTYTKTIYRRHTLGLCTSK
uniref:PS II complex 12 kDa extrinsic protein n=1 Tax=Amphora coffeiformis TaxID=265554 RepID=A0A7S3P3R4_9STRA